MNQTVQMTEQSLATQIQELIARDEVQLPPLPELALRIQEILGSDSATMNEVGELLQQDSAIVASLLRIANSAAFGGLGRINNLSAAVQRIGMRQVGAIVTGLGMKGHFQQSVGEKGEILEVLWDHSVTSAFAARTLARKVGVNPELAFLSGLLHDCGKVLVLMAIDRIEQQPDQPTTTRAPLFELMNDLHAPLGARVLEEWKLPEEVVEVASRHHDRVDGGEDLVLSVQAANLITRKLGFHLEPDPEISIVEDRVIEELGLDDMAVATLMIDMEDHLEEMKRLF